MFFYSHSVTRGFEKNTSDVSDVKSFKKLLRWDAISADRDWFTCDGMSIFLFAIIYNNTDIVKELLDGSIIHCDKNVRSQRLRSSVSKEGLPEFGILGDSCAIHAAMAYASSEIVSLLLEYGADPMAVDQVGNCALSFACFTGRADNVELWCARFPDWNLEKKNRIVRGYALGSALYISSTNQYNTVKTLLENGACVTAMDLHLFILQYTLDTET